MWQNLSENYYYRDILLWSISEWKLLGIILCRDCAACLIRCLFSCLFHWLTIKGIERKIRIIIKFVFVYFLWKFIFSSRQNTIFNLFLLSFFSANKIEANLLVHFHLLADDRLSAYIKQNIFSKFSLFFFQLNSIYSNYFRIQIFLINNFPVPSILKTTKNAW